MLQEKIEDLRNKILQDEYLNISTDVLPGDKIQACMAAIADLKKSIAILEKTLENNEETKEQKSKKNRFFE